MNMLNFSLVQTEEDIAALAGLAKTVWHEFFVCIITLGQIDYMVEKFQSIPALTDQIHNQGYEYYFMLLNGVKIGYVGIKTVDGKLFLSKLYILKDYRGKGYASQAFAFLEEICQVRNLTAIWLTVNRYNKNSIAVYQKKGFQVIRTQITDIGNSYVMDDYVMEKPI